MQRSTGTERLGDASDALAFELFFDAQRRSLFRALYLMTGSVPEAEELTQDAFLRVWENWSRVSAMENPVGYLYRSAMNLSRSRFRRVVRAAKMPFSTERTVDPYGAADAHDAVVRALEALPPRQRQALVLTDLLDRTTDEAAGLMHVTASTVRSLVSEAHLSMREAMEPDDE